VRRRERIYLQALDMLKKYPEFTFSFAQASPLREFLEANPGRKAQTKKFLAAKRLEIIGGCETICDLNMSRGASILRNIEMGRDWFRKELGCHVDIGNFEDAFGVCDQLPQILTLAGYSFYKASRMPIPGEQDVCGNFKFKGKDGSIVRCVSPLAQNLGWGWGYSLDPDDTKTPPPEIRYQRILEPLMAAREVNSDHVLCVLVGEEHDIFEGVVGMLSDLAEETDCKYRFSTFANYYSSLSEASWKRAPIVDSSVDLSRAFTGCYASRSMSKIRPRALEHRLLGAEMTAALSGGRADLTEPWRKLFVAQFHDAICGCHIKQNSEFLERVSRKAESEVPTAGPLLPWLPRLPAYGEELTEEEAPGTGTVSCGDYSIRIKDHSLKSVRWKHRNMGRLCDVSAREDTGTLWTEEYSGRKYIHTKMEEIVGVRRGERTLEIVTEAASPTFMDMWPGFYALKWRKSYRFSADDSAIRVSVQLDWAGSCTEIALRWHSGPIDCCMAESPFGSVKRTAYTPTHGGLQGDAFPALNWVKTDDLAILNRGTPGHAIRRGRLETLLLRSPVRSWNPWWPVIPEKTCWDNGKREFTFIIKPTGKPIAGSSLHKLGMEFNMSCDSMQAAVACPTLDGLPDNVVISSMRRLKNRQMEILLFEADGKRCVWRNETLGIQHRFRPYEIAPVRVKA